MENKNKKLYIARDSGCWTEEGERLKGRLRIFYDTPLIDNNPNICGRVWTNAREIGEIPNYMYPEIKEGEYGIFLLEEIITK